MPLTKGTKLGPYEVISALGAGGMGEVYRARDPRLNRDVALKVLPTSFASDPEHLLRFTREAQAAGVLNHPHILAVFDVGTFEGAPYLVSELLQGETLRTRLAKGPLPPSKVIDLGRQIADGLAAAHEKGIVHRDIKPANLFVTNAGRLKILDFGLARQIRSEDPDQTRLQTLTEAGVVMGTVGYMSPEQVRGEQTDARTDIFSFGAVLYEMVSGKRAFARSSSIETMHAILHSDLPELPAGALPSSLVQVILRCLEKDPAARFHSAHDLGLALDLVAGQSGAVASPVAAPTGVRWLHAAGWLPISLVAAGLGAFGALRLRAPAAAEPVTMESLTYSGHDASPAASPDGKTVAFMSDRDGVARIWLKQVTGGGELALTDGPDDYPRFSPNGSTIMFVRRAPSGTALYRVPLLGGDPRELLDDVSGADWSPSGRQIAFTRWVSGNRSGSIVGVADADGSNAREVAFVAGQALITPRWSPDERMIAAPIGLGNVATGLGMDLVDVANGRSRLLSSARPNVRQSSVVWSADSRSIIYSEAESLAAWLSGSSARIVRQDIASGTAVTLFWVADHSKTIDILGPGRLLLDTRSSRENLQEIPIGGAQGPARWLTRGNSTDRQPTYSPDGQWVAFSSNRGGNLDLWAVNRVNGTVRRLTDDPTDDWDVAYSPDGRRLLWGSNRSGPYEVWAANPDGSNAHQLSHDGRFAQNPQQTPDGQWVVYCSTSPEHPGLWRMRPDGRDPTRLVDGAIQMPEVSPDGRYAMFIDGLAGKIRVVRLEDGRPAPFDIAVVRRKETTAVLGRPRWTPDGRAIAFVGQDERGVNGVFVQDFAPGHDTTATRHKLGGFDSENSAESFAVSPDGKSLTVAEWEQAFSVMIASGVPGIKR